MIAANARLSTLVTANWRVQPTAAIASTAEVMSPKPTDAAKMVMIRSPLPAAEGAQRGAYGACTRCGRARWRAFDYPETARSCEALMLPDTCTAPAAV